MSNFVQIEDYKIGPDYPPFLVAEIGINHNGSLDDAVEMIHLAKMAGANAVKFQKRTPRICVPESEWAKPRETPWGTMPYIEYKERLEFNGREYDTINHVCKEEGILWFASVWDEPSVDFISKYNPPCYKIGSASLTDHALINAVSTMERPLIISTGMSNLEEIMEAYGCVEGAEGIVMRGRVVLCHSTSIYPCPLEKLNLRFIEWLKSHYVACVIGYSGHEQGVHSTSAAVALGASYIERHFTLDRRDWGTDQAASLEHWQFKEMAAQCHEVYQSLGDGIKVVYPEEEEKKASLRRTVGNTQETEKLPQHS